MSKSKQLLFALTALFYFATSPVLAVDYIMQRIGAGSPFITSSWGATWQGYIATPPTMAPNNGLSTHTLEFEFESPDYFQENKGGHFAVAVRADGVTGNSDGISNLRGRGIIIGNVHHYPSHNRPCMNTSKTNTIAIEDFWGTNKNCVYGGAAYGGALESATLQNNKRYKIRISSYYLGGSKYITQYVLWEWPYGIEVGRGTTVDDLNPSPRNLGGWFILEVFSEYNWTFYIYNLNEYWQTTAPASATCVNKVPIYTSQLNQPGAHDRYLTTSPAEHQFALKSGYNDADLITGYLEPSQKSNTALFRRFYNSSYQNHIATYDSSDISYLLSNGWKDDGAVGYIYTSQLYGTTPLYRLWKNHNGILDVEHRYTTNWLEVSSLQQQGWGYDGVYGYVCP